MMENNKYKDKPKSVTYTEFSEESIILFRNILKESYFSGMIHKNYDDFMSIYKAKFEELFQ